jgi:hypothetical protein
VTVRAQISREGKVEVGDIQTLRDALAVETGKRFEANMLRESVRKAVVKIVAKQPAFFEQGLAGLRLLDASNILDDAGLKAMSSAFFSCVELVIRGDAMPVSLLFPESVEAVDGSCAAVRERIDLLRALAKAPLITDEALAEALGTYVTMGPSRARQLRVQLGVPDRLLRADPRPMLEAAIGKITEVPWLRAALLSELTPAPCDPWPTWWKANVGSEVGKRGSRPREITVAEAAEMLASCEPVERPTVIALIIKRKLIPAVPTHEDLLVVVLEQLIAAERDPA